MSAIPVPVPASLYHTAKRIEAIYGQVLQIRQQAAATRREKSLIVGARVSHSKFGKGVIAGIEGEKVAVDFDVGVTRHILKSFVYPAVEPTPYKFPARPLPTRLASASKDVLSALNYAVWCIGETVIHFGGIDAMHEVMSIVENGAHGSSIGAWLDHRWNGVTDGDAIWCA